MLQQTRYNYSCVSEESDRPGLPRKTELLVTLTVQGKSHKPVTPLKEHGQSLRVTMYKGHMESDEVLTSSSTIEVMAGTSLRLHCVAPDNQHCEGQWVRGNGSIPWSKNDTVVQWSQIKLEDGGRYRCQTKGTCTGKPIAVEIEVIESDRFTWAKIFAAFAVSAMFVLMAHLIYLCYRRGCKPVDTSLTRDRATSRNAVVMRPVTQDTQSDHEVPYADIVISVRGSSHPDLSDTNDHSSKLQRPALYKMSVPFSNTTLRIPRGFGNLLEGLAKEVLRDQPEDIPAFAARYFSELLKAREESGLDPAEWGASLEDSNKDGNDTKTFGNNGNQEAKDLNACNSSDNLNDTEDNKKYELDKKQDEESGEAKHGPAVDISHVGGANVDICAQEVRDSSEVQDQEEVSENADMPRENDTADYIDICRSELDPTPLTSFGGLANVDVCAEEMNPPLTKSELTEDNRDMEDPESHDVQDSPINQFPESFIETSSHVDYDIVKQNEMSDDENTEGPESYGHIEKSEQEVSVITDTFLEDEDKETTEKVYLEESTERTDNLDITENSITSTTEAGQGTKERDETQNSEDLEIAQEYSSTNDIIEDEPSGETTGMKDTYIGFSDETYDSKSEIIDVLDEVIMSSENKAGNNTDEHSTSKTMDTLEEEELLESLTHAPEPDSKHSDTEDVTGNEILNTDVMDTSEKDPITETVNEASDLDSEGRDAEEMDQDDEDNEEEDQTKSMTFDDLSSKHEQWENDDGSNDSELKEVLLSETERKAEVIDECHIEAQELSEQTDHSKTDENQGDQFEDQEDKNYTSNLENPESSEEKQECSQPQEEEDIMDIPLDDP
ncbi:Sperm surface protein [Triplophysa tibetana]|uniref:Sperm surface protein n=1 Tax=Triplophysa tibetana TaxID=1572043 RepID=A0A5A9N0A8_9TELE|nr:Sperm surface protein [Triplophysa tibetana]